MEFHKYHGLGNDYLVLDPATAEFTPEVDHIRRICDRHCGIGSDGILWGPLGPDGLDTTVPAPDSAETDSALFGLRIFNPDGSEAEKSGNGLRIFARYLWDTGRIGDAPFRVLTLGGRVLCRVLDGGHTVTVDMGAVTFRSDLIPMTGPVREVLNESLDVAGQSLTFSAANIGNPHCVVISAAPSPEETCRLGPLLESDARFPNRVNVQFMRVLDRRHMAVEIWERGAGYTLASGSSASACAAVARRLGRCDSDVTVHMPGGDLRLQVDDQYRVTLTGPVTPVAHGVLARDVLAP